MSDLISAVSEQQRLDILDSYDILDSESEVGFDDIVLLARQICATPVALVSFVAADRQWFKAVSGFDGCETPLRQSICAHALRQPDTLVIPDLTLDERTRDNTLVTEEPFIRFYAGALLKTATGVPLGTVCVIDTVPRPHGLTFEQLAALEALARQVMVQLELRRALLSDETEAVEERRSAAVSIAKALENERMSALLKINEARLRLAQEAGKIGSFEVNMATDQLTVTEEFCRIYGVPVSATMPAAMIERLVVPEDGQLISTSERRRTGDIPTNTEYRIRKADTGEIVWVARRAQFIRDAFGRPVRMLGTVHDITDRKIAEDQQRLLHVELGHRLKNTLALVQAIASQTLRKVADRDAVKAFEQRIMALSSSHDVLLQQSWSAADMRKVVVGVLDLHGYNAQLSIDGPPMTIGPRAALSLSLLLHELATNAVKYGALSVPSGKVNIRWRRDKGDLVVTWTESGGPSVAAPTTKGLGTRLIDMGLSGTGQVIKCYDPSGVSVEIRAPLGQIESAS